MKVLMTAASKYGATGEIAQAIGNVLAEYGFETKVMPPEAVGTIEAYDAIVLGSAVYAGHWLRPAKELVNDCVVPSPAGGLDLLKGPGWRSPDEDGPEDG